MARIRKATGVARGAKDVAKEGLVGAARAAGARAADQAVTEVARVARRAAEPLIEHVARPFGDERGRLLTLLSKMEGEGKAVENLWRRRHEAGEQHVENRFIHNLCKLLPEGDGDKDKDTMKVLEWLNNLDDGKFQEALDLLDHDIATQKVKRVTQGINRMADEITRAIFSEEQRAGRISKLARALWQRTQEEARQINEVALEVVPTVADRVVEADDALIRYRDRQRNSRRRRRYQRGGNNG